MQSAVFPSLVSALRSGCPFLVFVALTGFILGSSEMGLGQSAAITIDEDFSDWSSGLASFQDGLDNGNNLDLLDFQVTNDADYLYLKFTTNTPIDLTDDLFDQNIWLHIDTDNDPSTGFTVQNGYEGTDLNVNFVDRYAWFNAANPNLQVSFTAIGLHPAPTVSSTTYEMAIWRHALPDNVTPLFTSDTIRILFEDQDGGDVMPNTGTVFTYVFDDTPVAPLVPTPLEKLDSNHIRLVNWNMLSNGGWASNTNLPSFEAIVTVLDADIYAFQESNGTSTNEAVNFLNTWIPLGTAEGWYAQKQGGLVTCSRWPIAQSWSLERQHAHLINLPDAYPKNLMVVNAHLSCCANDAGRQDQVDEFAAFVLDAQFPGGLVTLSDSTPIVMLGDMNFVGFAQQLKTVLTGDIQDVGTYGNGGPLDWDLTSLKDNRPLHADQRMAYTWRDPQGFSFPPGRLDFQFSTDAVFQTEKGYVLDTEAMSAARLAQYGLSASATAQASDHLPVVVDYSFDVVLDTMDTSNTSVTDPNLKPFSPQVYPNPSTGWVTLDFGAEMRESVVQVLDVTGREVDRVALPNQQRVQVELPVTPGLYFLALPASGNVFRVVRKE